MLFSKTELITMINIMITSPKATSPYQNLLLYKDLLESCGVVFSQTNSGLSLYVKDEYLFEVSK